jgi:hypothetical protein
VIGIFFEEIVSRIEGMRNAGKDAGAPRSHLGTAAGIKDAAVVSVSGETARVQPGTSVSLRSTRIETGTCVTPERHQESPELGDEAYLWLALGPGGLGGEGDRDQEDDNEDGGDQVAVRDGSDHGRSLLG